MLTRGGPAGIEETLLLPTWYEVDGNHGILDHAARELPWGGGKRMRVTTERDVLRQVETVVPRVVETLGVRDAIRLDGRLDARGIFRIFNVNATPGLEHPTSVMLHQLRAIWDDRDSRAVLGRLFATIAASAAERHGLTPPPGLLERAARTFPHLLAPLARA